MYILELQSFVSYQLEKTNARVRKGDPDLLQVALSHLINDYFS